ncbi:MAG: hypothetical protein ACRC1D_00760 [Culicoidibacterales bacterium]
MVRTNTVIPKETRKMVLLQLSMNVPKAVITRSTGLSFYIIQRIIAEEKAKSQRIKQEREQLKLMLQKEKQKQSKAKKNSE